MPIFYMTENKHFIKICAFEICIIFTQIEMDYTVGICVKKSEFKLNSLLKTYVSDKSMPT